MWLRYLLVTLLNILSGLFVLILLFAFLLPQNLPSMVMQLVGWGAGFLLALIWSHVAFSKKIPERRDTIQLVVFHVSLFLLLYASYGVLLSDRGAAVIVSVELVIQLIVEAAAICFTAFHLRRRKLQSILGEGRTV